MCISALRVLAGSSLAGVSYRTTWSLCGLGSPTEHAALAGSDVVQVLYSKSKHGRVRWTTHYVKDDAEHFATTLCGIRPGVGSGLTEDHGYAKTVECETCKRAYNSTGDVP